MSHTLTVLFHVTAGSIGLLSGAAAMSLRKGSDRHRRAGNVFVVSMLLMAATGALLGFLEKETMNALMGVLTFYLVITAWSTAKRGDGPAGTIDRVAMLVPLSIAVSLWLMAGDAPRRMSGGYRMFGTIAFLLALGDVRMLLRGTLTGWQRIGRHLRRMCLAMFLACGSFFLGQQQVFPAELRRSPILFLPVLLPIVLMLYWMLRNKVSADRAEAAGSVRP